MQNFIQFGLLCVNTTFINDSHFAGNSGSRNCHWSQITLESDGAIFLSSAATGILSVCQVASQFAPYAYRSVSRECLVTFISVVRHSFNNKKSLELTLWSVLSKINAFIIPSTPLYATYSYCTIGSIDSVHHSSWHWLITVITWKRPR